MNFMQKLSAAMQKNNSLVCVGLDPAIGKLPECIRNRPDAIYEFNCRIVDATKDFVCAYKPQAAYYAGQDCDEALKESIRYIQKVAPEVPVILDVKRGDIGSTAEYYAKEAFERYNADAVTVNPYMGYDAVKPFLDYEDKGV
ncbi:MAG: orotidine-5'-phosphate decarboxylase, partial [Lentisphaeria bacterium]|nr:orotidine-5'-phosphate decarboxylase [Lentisphaeria bacterium]